MKGARTLLAILCLGFLLPRAAPADAGATAFIDGHVHLEPGDPRASVAAALRAMPGEGALQLVVMPPPFTFGDPARYDAEVFLALAQESGGRILVLGGGGSLNAMLQESAAAVAVPPPAMGRFRARAIEILERGAAGFGELAAEHFSGATPYQSVAADHPMLLALAEIAGERGVPIVLHLEALQSNMDAFERLLAHEPRARIVWAHAGWDNTGYRTPALCRRLLAAHPNLYMDIKVDPARVGLQSLLAAGASGAVRPEWLSLLREFPDRFVMGTDQHYPEPGAATQRWQAALRVLEGLPAELREAIAIGNARRLFGGRVAAAGARP